MMDAPRGSVTFLFTDIEGSTRLWEQHPEAMPAAYARHDAILREAIAACGGVVYKVVGDAFQVAFPSAANAASAAIAAQVALQIETWPLPEPLRVRMVLHTGQIEPDQFGDYRSPMLNRAGRMLGAGHGGQILASLAAFEEAHQSLTDGGAWFKDLGSRRLKDLGLPEHIYQLVAPGIVDAFPELRTLDARPHNLPTVLSRFVGRHDDLEILRNLLGRPETRLVTLTGPGGIGKTRLALQVGADMLESFADGVFLVRLETLSNPADVLPAIVRALELDERASTEPQAVLQDYLRDKRQLLILDNFEQVIAGAPMIGDLLAACPHIKVLATSRTRLRLQGEHEYPLAPLGLPDLTGGESLDDLTQVDSLQLFVDRAQRVKGAFMLTRANVQTVAEICLRLDGIPLAIELAAARIRILPPEALLTRLSTRLPMLTGGARDLPARQQTLRRAIDWSYALLDEPAKALFRRLSVFAGGATLDAIDEVAVDDVDGWDVLAELESLVDQSLVRQTQLEGDPRFAMWETIREFGVERLEVEGESDEAHQRHATYFAGYPALGYTGASAEDAIHQVELAETERDNLRVAREWTLQHDLRLAYTLLDTKALIWNWRVPTRDEVLWTRDVVATTPLGVDDGLRARCRAMYAYFCYWYPDDLDGIETSLRMARDARRTFAALDMPAWVLRTLVVCSNLELARQHHENANAYIVEAVEVARVVGNPIGLLGALSNAGSLAVQLGDYARARDLLEEALALARDQPQRPDTIADVLMNLGELGRKERDLPAAELAYREALAFCQYQQQPVQMLIAMVGLALVAAQSGRWAQAAWLGGAIREFQAAREFSVTAEAKPQLDEHVAHMAQAREHLSDDVVAHLMQQGAAASMEQVLERVTQSDADSDAVDRR